MGGKSGGIVRKIASGKRVRNRKRFSANVVCKVLVIGHPHFRRSKHLILCQIPFWGRTVTFEVIQKEGKYFHRRTNNKTDEANSYLKGSYCKCLGYHKLKKVSKASLKVFNSLKRCDNLVDKSNAHVNGIAAKLGYEYDLVSRSCSCIKENGPLSGYRHARLSSCKSNFSAESYDFERRFTGTQYGKVFSVGRPIGDNLLSKFHITGVHHLIAFEVPTKGFIVHEYGDKPWIRHSFWTKNLGPRAYICAELGYHTANAVYQAAVDADNGYYDLNNNNCNFYVCRIAANLGVTLRRYPSWNCNCVNKLSWKKVHWTNRRKARRSEFPK